MRHLLHLLILSLISLTAFGQKADYIPTEYILEVVPDSSMHIDGKTNINTFDCIFKNSIKSNLTLTQNIFNELTEVQHSGLEFCVTCFDCGIALMNKEFTELLYAEQYPIIVMKLLSMYIYQGEDKTIKGKGKVSMIIAGVERIEDITYSVPHSEGKNFQIIGTKQINILDYGITPPKKMMGMVKVDQHIDVNFNFKFIVDDH
ncbi:YceI family protein [Flammeovirga aprica]|uniref:YceI family protein n=1 Tax=Flammeovirga aprica JL-4 TaxID=694437 RepID=A0A7X9XAD9_9BACT|nr:YceI family protein [Flammeovirga aprica]NME69597.1 YceI family protein [Flammeovirga aprica JL-4]